DQLHYKINDADAVPLIWKPEQYAASKRNFVLYRKDASLDPNKHYDLEEVIKYICTDDARVQVTSVTSDKINILPTKNFSIAVNQDAVLKNKIVALEDSALITDLIRFSIGETNTLDKSELGILNIIAGVAK